MLNLVKISCLYILVLLKVPEGVNHTYTDMKLILHRWIIS